jgi:hypothetical protein
MCVTVAVSLRLSEKMKKAIGGAAGVRQRQ